MLITFRDEINIALEHQIEAGLLGIVFADEIGGRVGFDSLIRLDLTRQQVEEKYINKKTQFNGYQN